MSSSVWKRVAVLVVVALLPVSAVAHTKLFYQMSYRSDYRKVEVMIATSEPMVTAEPTEEPTETPLVDIPLKSTLTPEPTLTLTPTEVPTSTPEGTAKISTPSDVDAPTTPKDLL